MINETHNPDVLNCLANLSSDEVFTSPKIANEMLDMLPQELFENPNTTFLDPCTKSGVFLREIAKRLLVGLEKQIPNLQERINHIFTKQLYGIAITRLTSLLSRRSLYCSKTADGKYSICDAFSNDVGNIKFDNCMHVWDDDFKCKYCGVNQTKETYNRKDMEIHAYKFIHTSNPEEIFNMKFDVIIGNPPYQLNVGVEKENYAIPIYDKFILQAKKLQPRYLSMIIPSRWFAGGRGLDDFRNDMLNDDRIRIIHDYINAGDCFPGVEIEGGVCYFLWNRDERGLCKVVSHFTDNTISIMNRPLLEEHCETFIRYNSAISVLHKVYSSSDSFSKMVSAQTPFGIISSFKNYQKEYFDKSVKFYGNKVVGYIDQNYVKSNKNLINCEKVYISAAYGNGSSSPYQVLNKPFYGEINSCCSQTYLVIGPFKSKEICENVISYIKTKFFRFMVMLKKNAQHAMRGVYQFVPMQDFSKSWTDEKLYKKYNLTQEEIDFIESMIKPME